MASTESMIQSTDATIARLRSAGLPKGIRDDIASASEIDHDSLAFPVHWDTGKDVTVNDLVFLFSLENDNADGISHGYDMSTENKQLEEVAGTDDETKIRDLHHFATLVNNTMNAIPFNTETEMEPSIILGKVASELECPWDVGGDQLLLSRGGERGIMGELGEAFMDGGQQPNVPTSGQQ
ncbi:hypothetical protein DM01DRAFT_313789 [Hesseltinella vesiculosa]|uniref:Uncharacterized protein n=1 Tax=Hesseltinella vesiculosa TaxID=101127 RepID=A0A1X2GC74_9FUNG|nr:hypothetical protein DM01DRAFT_313789 [Hesseltinella vesiculosa]